MIQVQGSLPIFKVVLAGLGGTWAALNGDWLVHFDAIVSEVVIFRPVPAPAPAIDLQLRRVEVAHSSLGNKQWAVEIGPGGSCYKIWSGLGTTTNDPCGVYTEASCNSASCGANSCGLSVGATCVVSLP